MNEIGVGLIGAGFMGRTSAEAVTRYLKSARLVSVTGGSRGPQLAADYGVDAAPNLDALLARRDVDAVMISTPHAAHVGEAVAAAEAGKHILIDKPMATSVEDCDRIIAAAERADVKVMVMFGQRFRDCNIAARKLVREGAIGKVRMIEEHMFASGGLATLPPWQSLTENVGVLIGHAVHNIDRIRWITGSDVRSVTAHMQRDPETGNEVSTMALLSLRDGSMATLWGSWVLAAPAFPRGSCGALIAGTEGNLDLDAYGELRLGKAGSWEVVARQEPIDWAGDGALSPVRMESYRRQHQEFIDAILEDREPSASAQDGRAAVEVAEAAYRSAQLGETLHLPLK